MSGVGVCFWSYQVFAVHFFLFKALKQFTCRPIGIKKYGTPEFNAFSLIPLVLALDIIRAEIFWVYISNNFYILKFFTILISPMNNIVTACYYTENLLRGKPRRPTVFNCYVDLTGLLFYSPKIVFKTSLWLMRV